jgi:hypothetical protein
MSTTTTTTATSTQITSSSSAAYIPQTAALYKTAFRNDPAITYILGGLSEGERYAYLEEYFGGFSLWIRFGRWV